MATVFFRTVIIYVVFVIAVRFMGKRQVGELQLSELVTTFMLSDLAITPIQDISIPLLYSIIPLVFLLSAEVITSYIMIKSQKMKKALFGTPSIIIRNGVLDQGELNRLRIGMSEFMGELRLKDVSDISDVEYAIIEQNGKLSVFLKSPKQTATYEDVTKKKKESTGIAHSIIIDGNINYSELRHAKKDEEWLRRVIADKNSQIDEIFLMTVNDAGDINIIKKDKK